MRTSIVWLKKDLRVQDHRPFYEACQQSDRVIALYIYEPEWLASYEFDASHLNFINQSLESLKPELQKLNIQLVTKFGSVTEVFEKLFRELSFEKVFAHQETGVEWTFARDKKVLQWCKDKSIHFKEYYQFAVIRQLKNRDVWNDLRTQIVERKLIPHPQRLTQITNVSSVGIMNANDLGKPGSTKILQVGGLNEAKRNLDSFLSHRSQNYLKSISSPWLSKDFGSRISPYLTYGNISLSQVQAELKKAQDATKADFSWSKSLRAFESRLWWHCHFIQKLESEYTIEYQNVNRAFDGLRESEFNESYFEAWKTGQTGYPMIDATMRCILQTGWVNFRMRAMLVSFAAYHLWLHWQKPAEFLAKHFLDFEPGIHFSQFQMQSGVTGINTIRIYSPIKQAQDQLHSGDFIRHYCPELSHIPDEYIHEPHSMPPFLLIEAGLKLGVDYPFPIVQHHEAYSLAKKRIFEWRSLPEVKKSAQAVILKHASRKNSNKASGKNHFPDQDREKIFGNLKK